MLRLFFAAWQALIDSRAQARTLHDVSTRRLPLLSALFATLVVCLCAFGGAPRASFVGAEHGTQGAALAASQHVDFGIVARPLRTPTPTAAGLAGGIFATLVLASGVTRPALAPRRGAALYTLFRVYRL